MPDIPLHDRSLSEIAADIRMRRLSPVEVTEAVLSRIETLDPRLRSFATVSAELARAQAQEAEAEIARGQYRSPLHGVPIAVKDLCFTKDVPTSVGMTIYREWRPDYDATVLTRLRQAGAVLVGKLHMTEGAMIAHHPDLARPTNPWHPDHWTGISSSGNGVATAAGLCFGSLGSDTGGSIRFPSAANGVTGLKPTWGRVSRYGVFPLAESLDAVGPIARTAQDCALLLEAVAGFDPMDPTSLAAPVPSYAADLRGGHGARGLRIGIDRTFNEEGGDIAVLDLIEAASRVFPTIGATLHDIVFPDPIALRAVMAAFSAVETALAHAATFPSRADEYGPELRARLEAAREVDPLQLGRAGIERDRFRGRLARLFTDVDAILVPVFARPLPTWDDMSGHPLIDRPWVFKFTGIFNHAGVPGVTLPCGFVGPGLPVGFQLIGPHLSEAMLLRAGHAFQQQTDWHLRRPEIAREDHELTGS